MCTLCCKIRCLLSVLMITAGMFMLANDVHADEGAAVMHAAQDTAPVQQPAAAGGYQPGEKADMMSGDYLLQLVTGMLIVIACIVVLAWFARRMNRLQGTSDGALRILGGISMGARERIVLIQVGEEQLLLGVAPGRINTLHVLEHEIADAAASATPASRQSFSQHLVDRLQSAVNSTTREQS